MEIAGLRRGVMRRGKRIKPVIKIAALALAIGAENFLYRKMGQAGWRLRP